MRAFRGTHYTAPVLRECELWDIGVLLDGDIAPPPPRIVIPEQPVPEGERPKGPRLREVD